MRTWNCPSIPHSLRGQSCSGQGQGQGQVLTNEGHLALLHGIHHPIQLLLGRRVLHLAQVVLVEDHGDIASLGRGQSHPWARGTLGDMAGGRGALSQPGSAQGDLGSLQCPWN